MKEPFLAAWIGGHQRGHKINNVEQYVNGIIDNVAAFPSIFQTKYLPSPMKQSLPLPFKSQLSLLDTFKMEKYMCSAKKWQLS
jgi:hypothetical protein